MLHKVDSSYREFAKYFPELKGRLSSSALKKQMLLDMAIRGEEKPHRENHPLGRVMRFYTGKKYDCYDPKFDREIRKLRSDWFVPPTDTAKKKKRQILEMARKGKQKPSCKTKLCVCLYSYLKKGGASFDPAFDREIRKLRPDWFVSISEIAQKKKRQLLGFAKKGLSRPRAKTKIGRSFCEYVSKKSECYDPKFDREIRKLRPDWFVSETDNYKRQLLEIAKKGEPRPKNKERICKAMFRYTRKKSRSYDPAFNREIRKLRPEWFVYQRDASNHKKQQLIKMASHGSHGSHKPRHNTKLGLFFYLVGANKKSSRYDPAFAKEIRKLRPEWFFLTSDITKAKKKQLLDMAKKGEDKPISTTKIGGALRTYAYKKSGSYDPEFTRQIRKLAPHWFRKCSTR